MYTCFLSLDFLCCKIHANRLVSSALTARGTRIGSLLTVVVCYLLCSFCAAALF